MVLKTDEDHEEGEPAVTARLEAARSVMALVLLL